ncbi:retrotransposon protein, putative, Ty3-gypsy subclass [Cucumis melo var. makuwa]|uniref:Retrotransposon protein, putative, Ty3-gypsy subclass n=1 Tax=Cucumis melo var. makuwa TaxID=1194695 RepID=A0A5D3D7Q5_CUCMM|nr:retrotransposon protein, putative, Ty3-gypsy subclass [Cucumis melo var. makuwa]
MMNKTTEKCPFEIVYTKAPRLTFDLTSLPKEVEIQEEVEELAKRIQKLHTEVIDHITKITKSYKKEKNKKRKEVHFQVGDLVMAYLRKKRLKTLPSDSLWVPNSILEPQKIVPERPVRKARHLYPPEKEKNQWEKAYTKKRWNSNFFPTHDKARYKPWQRDLADSNDHNEKPICKEDLKKEGQSSHHLSYLRPRSSGPKTTSISSTPLRAILYAWIMNSCFASAFEPVELLKSVVSLLKRCVQGSIQYEKGLLRSAKDQVVKSEDVSEWEDERTVPQIFAFDTFFFLVYFEAS